MANPELTVGLWLVGAAVVIPPASVLLSVFITRREVEQNQRENERRFDAQGAINAALVTKLEDIRAEAGVAAEKAAERAREDNDLVGGKLSKYVSELHDKINRVDKSVTGLEVETRLLTRQVESLGVKLDRINTNLTQPGPHL